MLKNPSSMKEVLLRQNSLPFLTKYFLLHYQISLLIIAGELWWMNKE
jgi:hypothetical protein